MNSLETLDYLEENKTDIFKYIYRSKRSSNLTSSSQTFLAMNENETSSSKIININFDANLTSSAVCNSEIIYLEVEQYFYLFLMCPLAIIGIILNLISLKVFRDKSFNSVTFKYLRLITLTDFFICIIIIPYCITNYTQPFNKYDMFLRHFYLAYVYIPGANIAINLSTLLNVLVTIERLISVGWPTQRYTLFKPSRYYLSCVVVITLSILSNIANFFLYQIELCKSVLPRSFTMEPWWSFYGYAKEIMTRILPIFILIFANVLLVLIVRQSRKKMRKSVNIIKKTKIKELTKPKVNRPKAIMGCFSKSNDISTESTPNETILSDPNAVLLKASKRNRQENQLTWMTVAVAILYLASSIPMVFAYPGIVFSAEQTNTRLYKMYAVLVNILELIQCSFRFFIYFSFTKQFRDVLFRVYGFNQNNNPNKNDVMSMGPKPNFVRNNLMNSHSNVSSMVNLNMKDKIDNNMG